MKRALIIGGGGSWGAYGGGTLARINRNYNTVIGISTGSLFAPMVALNEWELLKDAYINITNDDIFDSVWYKPNIFLKNGKFNALPIIISLLLGQKNVTTSNVMRKTIDSYFPENLYNDLKRQNKEILVGTQNHAQYPPKIHYFNSSSEKYEDFKDWMWCSANFPYFGSFVKKGWKDKTGDFHVGAWTDSGLTNLVGLDQLFNKGFKEIDIILHRTMNVEKFEGNKINSLIDNVITSINALRDDIEYEYFYQKIQDLNKDGAKITIYWLPRKLSANYMIFNRVEMLKWWNEGYDTALDKNRRQVFEPIKW